MECRASAPGVAEARRPSPSPGGPRRVLHLLAPASFGGLETVVRTLTRDQALRGLDVHAGLIVQDAGDGRRFAESLRGTGVHPRVLEVARRGYLEERRATAGLLAELRPHVVHTHGYRPDVVDAGLARASGVATVTTVHGFTMGGWRNRMYEWLQLRALRSFDGVAAVSGALAAELVARGVPETIVHTVPNSWTAGEEAFGPARARAELGVSHEAFHVGFVGRLSQEKGPDVLLEALARLDGLDFVASFVGGGPLEAELHARCSEIGLGERVRWHGTTTAADRLLTAFDVVVLPSRTEGTPLVLLEAMERGVPVVATRVGGVPELVSPLEVELVSPEDPEGLARAIGAVADAPGEYARRALAARRRQVERRKERSWVADYEDVYRAATDRRMRVGAMTGAGRPWTR